MIIEDKIHIEVIYFYNYILQYIFKRLEEEEINEEKLEEVINRVMDEEIEKSFILYNERIYLTLLNDLYEGVDFKYTIDFEKLKEERIDEIVRILAMDYTKQYFSRIEGKIMKAYLKRREIK